MQVVEMLFIVDRCDLMPMDQALAPLVTALKFTARDVVGISLHLEPGHAVLLRCSRRDFDVAADCALEQLQRIKHAWGNRLRLIIEPKTEAESVARPIARHLTVLGSPV